MDDFQYPHAFDVATCYRVRASTGGQWLATLRDGSRKATTDFTKATVFDDKKEAKKAWDELLAQPETKAKKPAWSQREPAYFHCPRLDEAPDSLTLYFAMSQGRFVGEVPVSMGGGTKYVLTPILAEATVFTSLARALSALASAMPSQDKSPTGSALPLRAVFGAPITAEGASPDPMAQAMAAASAHASIAHAVPQAEGEKKKPRAL